MATQPLFEKNDQYDTTAPAIVTKVNQYEALLFVNYDIVSEYKGKQIVVPVTGAKITRETEAEHPEFVRSLLAAVKDGKDVTKAFENDFIVIKGEEIQKHELADMLKDVKDPVILALFQSSTGTKMVDQYTNYLRAVGNLYGKTKTGKFQLKGVFPPSMDFKDGLQQKNCMKYAALMLAFRDNRPIHFKLRSVELAATKKKDADGEAFFG